MNKQDSLWKLFAGLIELCGDIKNEEMTKMLNDDIANIENEMDKQFIKNANKLIKNQLTRLKHALQDGKIIVQRELPNVTVQYGIKTDEYIEDIDKILAKVEETK